MSGDNNASSHHSVKAEPYVFPSSAILVYVDFKNVSHFRTSLLSSNNALDLLYSVGECGILASDVAAKSSLRTSSIQGVRPAASQDDFTTGDLQPLVQLLGGMPCDFAEREARLYQNFQGEVSPIASFPDGFKNLSVRVLTTSPQLAAAVNSSAGCSSPTHSITSSPSQNTDGAVNINSVATDQRTTDDGAAETKHAYLARVISDKELTGAELATRALAELESKRASVVIVHISPQERDASHIAESTRDKTDAAMRADAMTAKECWSLAQDVVAHVLRVAVNVECASNAEASLWSKVTLDAAKLKGDSMSSPSTSSSSSTPSTSTSTSFTSQSPLFGKVFLSLIVHPPASTRLIATITPSFLATKTRQSYEFLRGIDIITPLDGSSNCDSARPPPQWNFLPYISYHPASTRRSTSPVPQGKVFPSALFAAADTPVPTGAVPENDAKEGASPSSSRGPLLSTQTHRGWQGVVHISHLIPSIVFKLGKLAKYGA